MGALNVLRIIGLLLIGFLFLLGFGVFGISYYAANSAFTDNTAKMISADIVSVMPALLESQSVGLEGLNLEVNDQLMITLKPMIEKNMSDIFSYIRGESDKIGLGITTQDVKALVKNVKLPEGSSQVEISQIPDSMYSQMTDEMNKGFVQYEADLVQTLQPARDVYSYAKQAFYISLIVLIVLMLITLLINFSFYRTLFWLALYFLINAGVWILLTLGLYGVYSTAISQLFVGQGEVLSEFFSNLISWILFKFLIIYIILFAIGVVFLVAFIIWKIMRKKKDVTIKAETVEAKKK
ncbi:MAG: hypothetical protein PHH82_02650 [Candidatus ainarchaeum sp.]|nr:hypothetical protein [Candidatus ainarchaeum sp.]